MVWGLVFPHDYKSPLQKCVIRIDDDLYDVSHWKAKHPGGAEIIDQFHNADATEAFYGVHSKKAVDMLKKMPSTPADASSPKRHPASVNFQKLRHQLAKDGFYERDLWEDFKLYLGPCFFFLILGYCLAWSYPLLACLSMGLGMQQAGWLGHDYTHGRETSSVIYRNILCVVNGFSEQWWSQKHNTHHTFPNRKHTDSDVHNEPAIHLWVPSASEDAWYRKYQHLYYPIAYGALYFSWRVQSIQFVIGSGNWRERILIALGYLLLSTLPMPVVFGSILVGGWLVAVVVTANHQPEPMLEKDSEYDYVRDQFLTTRNVRCDNFITEYVFGGMQYQLEHHLFPQMPKRHYPKLKPIIEKFAKENNLPFKISGVMEIMKLNYDVIRKCAQK